MSHCAGTSLVAEISHQCAFITIVDHLVSSPQVTERNCASLLALTMVVEPIRVVIIHRISQLTSADLPIPRPDAIAKRRVSRLTWFPLMCSASPRSTSRCHLRGPLNFANGVFGCPHGNANSTKASGSFAILGDHNFAISVCSSAGL